MASPPLTKYPAAPYAFRSDNDGVGYPKGKPERLQTAEKTLQPSDHFESSLGKQAPKTNNGEFKTMYLPQHHFIRDTSNAYLTKWAPNYYPDLSSEPLWYYKSPADQYYNSNFNNLPVFSGATTNVNPFDSVDAKQIMEDGLESYEQDKCRKSFGNNSVQPPISALHPFTRTDPEMARYSNLTAYNRFRLPVADLEFRKGFHHIFFSRPECYLMSSADELCAQAKTDTIFKTAYDRYPHLVQLLSPCYVTGSASAKSEHNYWRMTASTNDLSSMIQHNWNYLLSNRVISMETSPSFSLENGQDHFSKSNNGFSVAIGKTMVSSKGGELNIRFRETKYLEVFEFLRLWMWYINKRYRGILAPSYNGYRTENEFIPNEGTLYNLKFHPYSRAIDYCASLFDLFTSESMTKILYWKKWYGIYPIEATVEGLGYDGIANSNEITVSAKFYYQANFTNITKNLVEFNYNSGLTDDVGNIKNSIRGHLTNSLPFICRENPEGKSVYDVSETYLGAAGAFTGQPYIVMADETVKLMGPADTKQIQVPYLQFLPVTSEEYREALNLGLNNDVSNQLPLVGVAGTIDGSSY